MRFILLSFLLFTAVPVLAQETMPAQAAAAPSQRVLIRSISIQGFVLDDRAQFTRLFRPYRNKRLSTGDVDAVLQQLSKIYEEAGYHGLVGIKYHISKRNLIFTVSLIK
ncbi:MAG: hypothetical protein KGK03_05685 [Candidatus Omnitrophica bacterium]|nr:hypothetical protein [Candidatus Omnitrophota bacterium]